MISPRLVLFAALLVSPGILWAKSERSAVGSPLPALNLRFPGGKPDTAGKVTLLEFWASWCPPCRTTIPHLNTLHDKFKTQGVVIIGVTDEDKPTVDAFLEKVPMRYNLALDREGKFSEPFQISGIPHAILYNKAGTAIWEGHPMNLDAAMLAKAVSGAADAAEPSHAAPRGSSADSAGDGKIYRTITNAQLREFLDEQQLSSKVDSDGDLVVTMQDVRGLMLCDKDYVQFRVAIRAKNGTMAFANKWNLTKRYSKCYLDADGDPVLELELDMTGGVHRDRIADFVKTCDLAVKKWLEELRAE